MTAQKPWRTALGDVHEDRIVVRGYDLLELIDQLDFGSMAFLLLAGRLPTPGQTRVMNAIFVSVAEHGISPSSTTTRFVAASGVPLQGSIAAGLLTFGDIHGGAGQEFARLLQEGVARSREARLTVEQLADEVIDSHRAARKRLPGYGHPQHPSGDPRAPKLLEIADANGVSGDHVKLARAIERGLERRVGRPVPMNIDGALGCLAGDLGLDWRLARALIITPRAVGLAAHAFEEQTREPGWRQITLDQVEYDGPAVRPLETE